jgi:hypothetical protein
VAQTAVETKVLSHAPTEKEWCVIWLRKLIKSLDDRKISNPQAAFYRSTFERFL